MKKNSTKVFVFLSLFSIISLLFAIRNSSDLWIFNDNIFSSFFVKERGNSIIFSLCCGVIPCYFFYIIQIYIPEKIKEHKAIIILKPHVHKLIITLKQAIFVYNSMPSEIRKNEDLNLYFFETYCNKSFIGKYDINNLKSSLYMQFEQSYNSVINSPFFSFLDSDIVSYISEIDMQRWRAVFEFKSNCYSQKDSEFVNSQENVSKKLDSIKKWANDYNIRHENRSSAISYLEEEIQKTGCSSAVFKIPVAQP